MKPILTILIFSIACSTFAQTTAEQEVAAQVEKLRQAMLKPDKATLQNLTAKELTYGHSSGVIEDQATFVGSLTEGKSVFKTIALENQTITVSGNTAIVRHQLTGDTFNNNTPGKVDILIMMVWQKQDDQWKLLARQAAKLPAPQPKN